MSVINKKPLINTILESFQDELDTLRSLIDGQGAEPIFRSLLPYSSNVLSAGDKGVKRAKLEISSSGRAQNVYMGYLLYNDDYCVLIAYSDEKNPGLTLIVMEQETGSGLWSYEFCNCGLSILELRSQLDDEAETEIEASSTAIKEVSSLPATGEENTIYLSSSNATSDGDPVVIPEPTAANAGKVLKVASAGGYELGAAGGTKLYKHEFYDSENDYTFYLITSDNAPFDFNTLNTFTKLHNRIVDGGNMIRFYKDNGYELIWDTVNGYFVTVVADNDSIEAYPVDDWNLEHTTELTIEEV